MEVFRERTALITGASAGLGAEFARQLAPVVGRLILVARRKDRLEALSTELSAVGSKARIDCWPFDLETELEEMIARMTEEVPDLLLLVNNAGLGDEGAFVRSEAARLTQMLRVNIEALTRLSRAVLPGMIGSGLGYILNVSSVASFFPLPGRAVYAATKAYVSSLSEALRMETEGQGIRVTALCPGPVDTEFSQVATRSEGSARTGSPNYFKVSAPAVVTAGLRAVVQGKPRVVPGLIPWGLAALSGILPMALQRAVLRRANW